MWMGCDDSGEEDSDEEANHDEQIGQREHLNILPIFQVLFDWISRLGQDVNDGDIDKESTCKGGAHRFQELIPLKGSKA